MPEPRPSADAARSSGDSPVADGSSSSAARVRPLRMADLPEVLAIENASFATPWSAETFANLLARPNAHLVSAVDDADRVRGYAAVWFAGPEGELGDLAVHPSARRCGIGSALVAAVIEEARARGAAEIFLEVRESNEAAQKLYLGHAFEIVGRRPGYYSGPVEDALVMRRLLAR